MKLVDLLILCLALFSAFHFKTFKAQHDDDDDVCEEEEEPDVCPFDENVSVTNVALNRPATQSSNYRWGFGAELAVDGNTGGWFWESKTCSHTDENGELFPWLKIDLGGRYLVKAVSIYTRLDPCCNSRYHDMEVRVGNVDESGKGQFHENGVCNITGKDIKEPGHVFNLTCEPCLAGRYVTLQIVDLCAKCDLPNYNILHVCEFKVFGAKV